MVTRQSISGDVTGQLEPVRVGRPSAVSRLSNTVVRPTGTQAQGEGA